jgi:hypothetical protein
VVMSHTSYMKMVVLLGDCHHYVDDDDDAGEEGEDGSKGILGRNTP